MKRNASGLVKQGSFDFHLLVRQQTLTEQTLSSWRMTVSGMCVFGVGVKISLVSRAK